MIKCIFIYLDLMNKCTEIAEHYYYDEDAQSRMKFVACCGSCNIEYGYYKCLEVKKLTQEQYLNYQILK